MFFNEMNFVVHFSFFYQMYFCIFGAKFKQNCHESRVKNKK